jgi:serine/threonine-protein kinase
VSTNSTDPLIGRLIDGRYQVRSRIARGGMATVYLATDLRLERRVAIKVMHGHLADDSQYKARFIQEARSAARLAHPNVVNVYDQGQDGETAYLVMEYLPGITLRDLLQEHKVLTTVQALDIMEAILSGLAAAHKNGIVHRDLKPENVLLADDGRIKISDFGLARAATANTATGDALLGTIAYLSPELVTRGIADARSDIYAVGIMLYEMLAGEQPFRGEQAFQIAHQHANDTVPSPSAKNPRVPVELDELVLWATARDPEQRPRDAKALLEQLHEAEALLRSESPATATGQQRTVVMPAAFGSRTSATQLLSPGTTAETQAFAPKARHRTGPILTGSVETLSKKSDTRRRKGWWIFALVLLLAGGAAGTGYYFGPGPGGQVTIPKTVNSTPAAAKSALETLGLTVDKDFGQAFSPEIPTGSVVGTTPPAGRSVVRDSTVTILVSQGPKQLAYTSASVVGQTRTAAIAAIKDMGFTYNAKGLTKQFDAKIPADTVIAAYGSDGVDLSTVPDYGDKQPVSLLVSAGAIPDVAGKTFAEASSILKAKKLTAQEGQDAYSDTVPSGNVIGVQASKDAAGNALVVKPGDTVQLTISKGIEQVQIPGVVGMTYANAKAALTAAGFEIAFTSPASQTIASVFPNSSTVTSASPSVGQTVDKGSKVTIALSVGG